MSWRRRLCELIAAGGTLAACDSSTTHIPCGNADPDPCICDRTPLDAGQCVAEKACADALGTWVFGASPMPPMPDAAPGLNGYCQPRQSIAPGPDAGLTDVPPTDVPPTDVPPTDAPHD